MRRFSMFGKLTLTLMMAAMISVFAGCSDDDDNVNNPTPQGNSLVRVGHLSPDAPNVDVRVDDDIVLTNVPYGTLSGYLNVTEGNRRIRVSPTGTTTYVIDATVSLTADQAYTIAASGLVANIQALVLQDDRSLNNSQAKVRFVHTSPGAPSVDIALPNGGNLFTDVEFGESTGYLAVAGGFYRLLVRPTGTSTNVLDLAGLPLAANTNYTIFATGQVSNGTLFVTIAADAPNATTVAFGELRVAHLSPDAPSVDVWIDESKVLENVPFQAVSGYLKLPAVSHRVQVSVAGSNPPAVVIDANVPVTANTAYTVAARGLVANITASVYTDDRTPGAQAKVRFIHTSPDAPNVDVTVAGGSPVLFGNIAYPNAANYVSVAGNTYNLEVRVAGTQTVALEVANVVLTNRMNYTIFATGTLAGNTLGALAVIDSHEIN